MMMTLDAEPVGLSSLRKNLYAVAVLRRRCIRYQTRHHAGQRRTTSRIAHR